MKKNHIVMYIMVAACSLSLSASAQEKLKMELSFNVSTPLGSFKNDFIKNTSYRGGSGELSYTFNPKFSLGLHSGFQSYYQKYERQVYKLQGNQTVSAVVSNTLDMIPVMLRGTFSPLGASTTAKVQPYVSAGAGVSLVNYGQYLGEFGGNESAIPFAAQAGAGIKIPFGNKYNQAAFKLGGTYNFTNYNRNEIKNLQALGFNVGVVFALR